MPATGAFRLLAYWDAPLGQIGVQVAFEKPNLAAQFQVGHLTFRGPYPQSEGRYTQVLGCFVIAPGMLLFLQNSVPL